MELLDGLLVEHEGPPSLVVALTTDIGVNEGIWGLFRRQGLLVQALSEYGVDAFVGEGLDPQGSEASGLQAFGGIAFTEPDDAQAGAEALFGMRAALEDPGDELFGMGAVLAGPADDPFRGPLEISLVRLGTVLGQGGIPAAFGASPMAGHPLSLQENLNREVWDPHVDLLANEAKVL